jgi:beta-carotene 3-hydroxylase
VPAVVLIAVSFVAMEAVSYALHRWVMHGIGMAWHRSHHQPDHGGFERNDLFPLCFSALGVLTFALASYGPAIRPLFWVGTGVTAYGACYAYVHDVFIHQRLRLPAPRLRVLAWLREAHRVHHLFGGEPYGMLLPLVPRALRERAERRSTRLERIRL